MSFIADFHIHSHFSRATSQDLIPEDLSFWAQKKGIALIGTGDFTHPGWLEELREKLVEAETGLFRLRPDLEKSVEKQVPPSCRALTRFVLSGEISCIYKRGDKTRKIHNLVLLPDFDAVKRLNERLERIGNIVSDGRPILGLDSRDLLETVLEASDRAFFVPAHIWTHWFSLFGSKSGFDTIEECFRDLTPHIHALETGLSSDPPMNRLLSSLDNYVLLSNSDAHSAAKLGREANLFDVALDYDVILKAMIDKKGFSGTIEFFPEEGKYHYDGHRKCRVSLHPSETRKHQGLCPGCGKSLTVGVLHRVYELADRDEPKLSKDFRSLIPLSEILSEMLDCGPSSKKVIASYEEVLASLGPELHILMNAPLTEIEKAGGPLLREAIDRMRQSRVIRKEGYDGEYGVIRLFEEAEKATLLGQHGLFGTPIKTMPLPNRKTVLFSVPPVEEVREEAEPYQAFLFDPILDPLNPAQKEAVLHQGSHLLIVAGPGTGKTMTLTHRIAYQIRAQIASPEDVLSLTFTNKAAGEMRKRLTALLPEGPASKIWVSTFHAFCLEILRQKREVLALPSDFGLISEADALALARQVVSESKKGRPRASRFLKELPHLKMNSLNADQTSHPLADLHSEYQRRLRSLGMLDLDDLQVETLRLFQHHEGIAGDYGSRFSLIYVDEYQDTNPIQVSLLKALIGAGSGKICAIGDPDQAIYGFRGADVRNFHRFEEDFPGAKEVTLLTSYRSTQPILDAASNLMQKKRKLQGVLGIGEPVQFSDCRAEADEAEMIVEQIEKMIGGTSYFSLDSGRVASHEEGESLSFGDIAVLFRLNALGDAIAEALSRAGIPFIRSGEKPLIEGFPVNVIRRFLQTVLHPGNEYYREAYHRLLKDYHLAPHPPLTPPPSSVPPVTGLRRTGFQSSSPLAGEDRGEGEGGGERTLLELIDHAVALHGFRDLPEDAMESLRHFKKIAKAFHGDLPAFLDALSLDRGIDHEGLLGDRVALMSLHAAKGLEWPVVFIIGCEDQLLPCTLFGDRDEEEEKRLFYVGMTRARSRLVLSGVKRRRINGRPLEMKPSPFISLVPKDLRKPLERRAWKRKKKPPDQLQLF